MSAQMSASPYQYHRLPENCIRLLELQPASYGEPLRGSLRTHSLVQDVSQTEKDDASEPGSPSFDIDVAGAFTSVVFTAQDERRADIDLVTTEDQYETISYVWGSELKPQIIYLEENSHVHITESLYEGLQHFRLPDRTRVLWADAICINQALYEDKSQQVALMGSIYSNAVRTVVWLGESQGTDYLSFALLEAFEAVKSEATKQSTWLKVGKDLSMLKPHCTCCRSPTLSIPVHTLEMALEGLNGLFSRAWFTRLWVVQEALLSKALLFQSGSHITQITNLTHMLMYQDEEEPLETLLAAKTIDMIRRGWAPIRSLFVNIMTHTVHQNRGTFLDILGSIGDRGCMHPLDRVYALRAVCCISLWSELKPDYKKRPVDLYTDLVWSCLRKDSLETAFNAHWQGPIHPSALLAIAPRTQKPGLDASWPSWVIDLHNLPKGLVSSTTKMYPAHPDEDFRDGGGPFTPYALTFEIDRAKMPDSPSVLDIWGQPNGIVLDVLPESSLLGIPGCDIVREPIRGDHVAFSNQDALQAWAVRCAEFVMHHQSAKIDVRGSGSSGEMREFIENLRWLAEDEYSAAATERCVDYMLWLASAMRWRFLDPDKWLAAVRIHGRVFIGSVPADTKIDDNLCLLFGSPHCFVARESTVRRDAYQLIGDAQIDGLTEVEALDEDKAMLEWIEKLKQIHSELSAVPDLTERERYVERIDMMDKAKPCGDFLRIL